MSQERERSEPPVHLSSIDWLEGPPQKEILFEAQRLVYFSKKKGITLRLLGGAGIFFASPSASKETYARKYNDLDFIGKKREGTKISKFFIEMGYHPRELFNKLQGDSRLIFLDRENDRRVDIFLDGFVMCHKFDFKDRLDKDGPSLAPADLLLTKLQIVEINKKDIMDIAVLVLDNPPLFSKEKHTSSNHIEVGRLVEECSEDWGVYKTITLNIDKITGMLHELGIPSKDADAIEENLAKIKKAIEEAPKTFRWKMRARVGEKVRWYELPESANA
ncbi:MAG: hypothetical protein ACYCQJ_07230 [Nitrososphaerales archaeon]